MRVSEAMTREVRLARRDQSLQDVAAMMAELDAGALPVGEDGQLVGMVTDRDIAIRGIARGKGPEASVSEVMTADTVSTTRTPPMSPTTWPSRRCAACR